MTVDCKVNVASNSGIFLATRKTIEERSPDYDSRELLRIVITSKRGREPGNLPLVQLNRASLLRTEAMIQGRHARRSALS